MHEMIAERYVIDASDFYSLALNSKVGFVFPDNFSYPHVIDSIIIDNCYYLIMFRFKTKAIRSIQMFLRKQILVDKRAIFKEFRD